ncbi:MAG: hypothetical protein IH955_11710 [Chloroflexi bacterium]|nr:hypothetical protein [Chloroflexota bacterium]
MQDLLSQCHCLLHHLIRRYDLVHQMQVHSLLGRQEATCEQQLQGQSLWHAVRQQRGTADRRYAPLGLRPAKPGLGGGHTQVGAEGQPASLCQAHTVYRCQDRFPDTGLHQVELVAGWLDVSAFRHVRQVMPGAECSPLARNYGQPHIGVISHIVEDDPQLLAHLRVDGVELLGTVKGDIGDLVFDLVVDSGHSSP